MMDLDNPDPGVVAAAVPRNRIFRQPARAPAGGWFARTVRRACLELRRLPVRIAGKDLERRSIVNSSIVRRPLRS
jgi:hypothetical protein